MCTYLRIHIHTHVVCCLFLFFLWMMREVGTKRYPFIEIERKGEEWRKTWRLSITRRLYIHLTTYRLCIQRRLRWTMHLVEQIHSPSSLQYPYKDICRVFFDMAKNYFFFFQLHCMNTVQPGCMYIHSILLCTYISIGIHRKKIGS